MEHNFIKYDYTKSNNLRLRYIIYSYEYVEMKICQNCQLVVLNVLNIKNGENEFDLFFIEEKEIFENIKFLQDLKLNCNDIIIKNLIE